MMKLPFFQSTKAILKKVWLLFAAVVILVALLSSFFRALTPFAVRYRADIEDRLSLLVHKKVVIGQMETGWYWFQPVIKLSPVSIMENGKTVIQLQKLEIGIHLLNSLWHRRIEPGILYIDALNLTLEEKDSRWQVKGLVFGKNGTTEDNASFDSHFLRTFLGFALSQKTLAIRDMKIDIHWQDGARLNIQEMNFRLTKSFGLHRVRLDAAFNQRNANISLIAEASIDSDEPEDSYGRAYLSARGVPLWVWRRFFPSLPSNVKEGGGDVQVWLDWGEGKITAMQSRLDLQGILWMDALKATHFLPRLMANLAFNVTPDGYSISGDHVRLALGHIPFSKETRKKSRFLHSNTSFVTWPENSFNVQYHKKDETWDIYVKHFLLKSFLPLLPSTWQAFDLKDLHQLDGNFEDVHGVFNPEGLQSFLVSFSKTGFQGTENLPKLDNFSGAFSWKPDEGRLELDSQNALVVFKNKKPLLFQTINGIIDWKKLTSGFKVSMDRFVLEHADLTLNASGDANDITKENNGFLNLALQLSANHVERWFSYLPNDWFKPAFNRWLKQDIHRLDTLAAEVHLKGDMAHFPFDETEGEFLVKGYASGMNFTFADHFPMARAVDAYLSVKKRNFEANVVHALLGENLLSDATIKIDDIGLSHETLVLQSMINTDASKAVSYLVLTPLSQNVQFLKDSELRGPLKLKLGMEIPLYASAIPFKMLGEGDFHENTLLFSNSVLPLQADNLQGILNFNEMGVQESHFTGTLFEEPLNIVMHSVLDPLPHLEVTMHANTNIEVLPKTSISSFIHGRFPWDARLIFSSKSGILEKAMLESSLIGVSSTLPKPLKKGNGESLPIKLEMTFPSMNKMLLQLALHERLKGYFLYLSKKGNFYFDRGMIRFGHEEATMPKETGLFVLGELKEFSVPEWQGVFSTISHGTDSLPIFRTADIFFKTLIFDAGRYQDVGLKVTALSKDNWSIDIKHQIMEGHLVYASKENRWSGEFSYLNLTLPEGQMTSKNSFLPKEIEKFPNLDFKIKEFKWNGLSFGEFTLRTHLSEKELIIDEFAFTSPYWRFAGTGNWTSLRKNHQSKLQATLEVKNLAKMLEQFSITPVVESKKGLVQFELSWPRPFYDFSLGQVEGHIAMSFKNGRITHLSPETEEKLGLGKLLSILSLQTIPRRLTLDFSDLSHHGYSFDEFRGDFNIAKGRMSTSNSYIDGPIAYGSIKGDLDIVKQLYHLELKISPHVTASLPIVATIAGGPVAGIATWAVSKIITQGMQKISGYTYRITGPWNAPLVQQVSMTRKK